MVNKNEEKKSDWIRLLAGITITFGLLGFMYLAWLAPALGVLSNIGERFVPLENYTVMGVTELSTSFFNEDACVLKTNRKILNIRSDNACTADEGDCIILVERFGWVKVTEDYCGVH